MKVKSREVTYATVTEKLIFSDNSVLLLKQGTDEQDPLDPFITITWLDKNGKPTPHEPAWATPQVLDDLLNKSKAYSRRI